MTGPEARAEFAATLAAFKVARARRFDQGKAIEAQLEEELETRATAAQKALGKKRGKKSARTLLPVDELDGAIKEYQGRFNRAWDLTSTEMRGLEQRLRDLAPEAEIRRGEPRTVYTGDPYTYAGQTEADGYARRAAECRAQELQTDGFEVKIERVDKIFGVGDSGAVGADGVRRGFRKVLWEVRVPLAEELDVEILKKRPAPPIKEQIRNLLKHGINPWVVDPFLPRDIMEKLRLDWQGRDVPDAKFAGVAPPTTETTPPKQQT